MKEKVKLGLKAPFPWFGGKSRVADKVWARFGDVKTYVEPFAGSLSVLLGRPHQPSIEIVNDKDAYLENFWRAVKYDPEGVAKWCDYPVNEAALHSRHVWLVGMGKKHTRNLMIDPDYYDVKVAGWWAWGVSMWIAGGWCTGGTPHKSRPNLGLQSGVHRKRNMGVDYFLDLSDRLRCVQVCCGDWTRVLGKAPLFGAGGMSAVFLDPPYGDSRKSKIYNEDDTKLYLKVRDWAIEHGDNSKLRIALCGYGAELDSDIPSSWSRVQWSSTNCYAHGIGKDNTIGSKNRHDECIWFSPHCLTQRVGLLGRPIEKGRR